MSVAKLARNSHAAGEVSPELWHRDELARQQIGAKRIENLVVMLEGGLARAPGTRFVDGLVNQAQKGKLIPFRYNDKNAYELIFNAGKMRVKKDGGIVEASPGTPYQIDQPYAEADLENLRFARDRDLMFLTDGSKRQRELRRRGHADWDLTDHETVNGPVGNDNTDENILLSASAVSGDITIDATEDLFVEGDVGGIFRIDDADIASVAPWVAGETITTAGGLQTGGDGYIGDMVNAGNLAAAFDGSTNQAASACAVKNSGQYAFCGRDYGSTPRIVSQVKVFGSNDLGFSGAGSTITIQVYGKNGTAPAHGTNGTKLGQISFQTGTNESAGRTINSDDQSTTWRYVWVRFSSGTVRTYRLAEMQVFSPSSNPLASQRRHNGNVYQALNSGATGSNPPVHDEGDAQGGGASSITWRFLHRGYGFVRITGINGPTQATGVVLGRLPNSVVLGSTFRWAPPAWSDAKGWPTRLQFHQGRLWWFRENEFWASQPRDFANHEPNNTPDGAISGRILSPDGSVVDIEWALASGQLILGTVDGEWILRSGTSASAAVTTENITTLNDTTEGSAKHIPAQVEGGALLIGKSRARLHFARFDRLADRVQTQEVTISSRHILRGATHVVFQRDPHRIAWVVNGDGSLRALAFMPAQEVSGFSRRLLKNGVVEDICVNSQSDGAADVVTLLVRRVIGGETRRYVEEMAPFFEPLNEDNPTAEGAWYLDSALRYQGAPSATISGLDHLIGEEVGIFADGAMRARQTVSEAGTVTLDRPASDALIGIPLEWFYRSLSLDPAKNEGSSKFDVKHAPKVGIEVVKAAGNAECRVNPSPGAGEWERLFEDGAQDYAEKPGLTTGRVEVDAEGARELECIVELRGTDAMPFGLAAIVPDVSVAKE